VRIKLLETKCPGCGSALFVLGCTVEQHGTARMSIMDPRWVLFVRTEELDMVCAAGCEVRVRRESGERTAKKLEEIGELPLVREALGVSAAVNIKEEGKA
jgi:hypothetical protein